MSEPEKGPRYPLLNLYVTLSGVAGLIIMCGAALLAVSKLTGKSSMEVSWHQLLGYGMLGLVLMGSCDLVRLLLNIEWNLRKDKE